MPRPKPVPAAGQPLVAASPVPRPKPARAAGQPLSPAAAQAAQAELKASLIAKRSELIAKLREEREGRRDSGQREKIEGTPFGDRPGLSPDDEMGFAVADRRAEMLAQINLALKKMEEGNYGRCEVCEEPINVVRLRVHPFAVRCTRCQEAWERDQSRGDAGGGRTRGVVEDQRAD
jgi:DnaK suppressor protein